MSAKTRLITRQTLVDQVASILQKRIVSGEYSPGSQLPVEAEIAREFDTSRTTIRAAMDRLVSKHLIIRRHGIGTFIADLPKILDPLDVFTDFQTLIRNNGYHPEYHQYSFEIVEANDYVQELFHLQSGDKILEILKYWTADNDPVVFCKNHIPLWLFSESKVSEIVSYKKTTEPILDFFEECCNQELDYYLASIRCDIIRNCDFEVLYSHYEPETPMLIIDEVGYNTDGVAVHHSIEYHPDNIMKFSITRRCEPSSLRSI